MHILLKVASRTEKADGTVSVTLIDPALTGSCSLVLAETADQTYKVGDRYELSIVPLARIAQPAPTPPRAGLRSLDVIGTAGAKATVETNS